MSAPGGAGAPPAAAAARRPWGAFAVRALVSAAVLAALLAFLPTGELWAALRRVPPGLWALVLGGFAAGHAVAALKWRGLLHGAGLSPRAPLVLRAHAAGLFANLCLPSLVGGDVVRAGWVSREGHALEAVAVAGLADRFVDTAALVALAAVGAAWLPDELPGTGTRVLALAAALLALAAAAALCLLRGGVPGWLPARGAAAFASAQRAVAALARRPALALRALGLALAIQAAFVALNAVLGAAIGIHLPAAAWLLAWPLAKLAALVPVSLGGMGVREAALAALLSPFGVAPALAVGQSLLWETVLVALGLVAGLGALLGGRALRSPA